MKFFILFMHCSTFNYIYITLFLFVFLNNKKKMYICYPIYRLIKLFSNDDSNFNVHLNFHVSHLSNLNSKPLYLFPFSTYTH